MSEYTVRYINYRAESDAAAFIHDCEEHYHRQIHMAADEIMRDHVRRPIVLINGPSSSGKTTTNDRIARIVELAGVHAEMLSMDDYYRPATEYDQPMDDENGVPDLESPECMDLERLSSDLKRLAAGEEVSVPRFDFETRTSIPHDRTLQLGKDEVIMIEGIHSFNPVIMGDLAHRATSIYLSVASALVPEKGARLEPYMLRFLRRAMRDSLFRSSPVEATLRQWNSVRRGERLYISPYRGQADIAIDTFLPYEVNILMERLMPVLRECRDALKDAGLAPVSDILGTISPIAYEGRIPEDSVLHEFIG